MKVILQSDIGNLGKKNDIVTVSDGYAQNYLIPRKLAEQATESRVVELEKNKATQEAEYREYTEKLHKELEQLAQTGIEITAPANDQGSLFAGIHTVDMAEAITEKISTPLSEEAVVIDDSIKETGTYEIDIRVGDERVSIPITVTADSTEQKSASK